MGLWMTYPSEARYLKQGIGHIQRPFCVAHTYPLLFFPNAQVSLEPPIVLS
jgi:hypothetical protein